MPRVRASAQKRIHFTHLRGKLESIVLRRILQLLVKTRDRVDQDDFVTSGGDAGFEPPASMRADQVLINGVRLPYLKFPRNPTN